MKRFILLLVIAIFLTGCDAGTSAKATLDMNGTSTVESYVGGDVYWTAMVTNKGSSSYGPFRVTLVFKSVDIISIDPEPMDWHMKTYPQFPALAPGASVTITMRCIAKSVGIAEGSFIPDGIDGVLRFKTVIR